MGQKKATPFGVAFFFGGERNCIVQKFLRFFMGRFTGTGEKGQFYTAARRGYAISSITMPSPVKSQSLFPSTKEQP